MGDASHNVSHGISRRDFLKLSGAALLASVAGDISKLHSGEILTPGEFRLASLRLTNEEVGEYAPVKDRFRTVTSHIKDVLRNRRVNLIITPEYTFEGYDANRLPLILENTNKGFVLDKKVDNSVRDFIDSTSSLAKSFDTNFILSTFNGPDSKKAGRMIMINNKGTITGIKDKFTDPVGEFNLAADDGHKLKLLPLICGDAWENTFRDEKTKEWRTFAPDWVTKEQLFDILVHTLGQGDVDFDLLAARAPNQNAEDIARAKHGFQLYYDPYMPYLTPKAAIVISDLSMAGTFNRDLKEPLFIENKPGYFVGGFSYK